MASINVRISRRPYWSRRNNSNMRRRNVHNLIPISVLKPGPPSAKLIPKCLVLNARSLVKPDAASALCTEVTTNKIDVCFISETWLNSNVPSNLICPDGYALIRKDRLDARPGGGVAILCRKDWKIDKLDYNDQWSLSVYGVKSRSKIIISTMLQQFIIRQIQLILNPIYWTI